MCIFLSRDLGFSKVLRDFEMYTQMHGVNASDFNSLGRTAVEDIILFRHDLKKLNHENCRYLF